MHRLTLYKDKEITDALSLQLVFIWSKSDQQFRRYAIFFTVKFVYCNL